MQNPEYGIGKPGKSTLPTPLYLGFPVYPRYTLSHMLPKLQNILQRLQKFLPYVFVVLLLVCGSYVTLFFIGTDGHIVVLLKSADWQGIGTTVEHPFLRGLLGLVPFIRFLFVRLQPFLGYAIVSLCIYGAVIGWVTLGKGRMFLKLQLSALHVLLLGIGALWLITTSFFYGSFPDLQPRLLIEPKTEVYKDVPEETLAALQKNFEELESKGCLIQDPVRRGAGDARVFTYRGWCMQMSFLTRVLPPLGILLFLTFDFLILGSIVLSLLRLRSNAIAVEFIMALALGATALMMVLWVAALFHSLTAIVAWGVLFAIPILGYRYALYWLRHTVKTRWDVELPFHSARLLLLYLLLSLLAFNYLTVIRPFPIGWDDLGRYINLPRQLSVAHQILPSIPAIQWEYLTSLGFLLFGYFSTFGAVLAQQINWMAGVFAVLAVYLGTKILLGSRAGLLAALFYYLLPMTGHYSFADMKTENALFFFGVVGLIAVFLAGFNDLPWSVEERSRRRWLFVAGILFGAAFATKATMVLMGLMGGVVLGFGLLGLSGGVGAIFFSFFFLMLAQVASVSSILHKMWGIQIPWLDVASKTAALILGVFFVCLPLFLTKQHRASILPLIRSSLLSVLLLLLGVCAFSAPWMVRNSILNGRISTGNMLKAPNTITPWVRFFPSQITKDAPPGSRSLPEELRMDATHPMCAEDSSRTEELDRYWGHGTGIQHYAGLPWRVVMNQDSQGFYLTTSPLLLLVPLVLFLPAFWRRRAMRALFVGTIFYLFAWMIVGNGIPWYGIGMFFGLSVLVEALIALSPNIVARLIASFFVAIALGTSVSLRLWQFGMQYNLYEYAWGKASHEVLQEMTIPNYDDITENVMRLSQDPNHPYLYRMGTFISYFIPNNQNVIVVNDNQLGFFSCLNQEEDHLLTLKRLKALGFHSIVFDTNTATIEKDSNGTLHQKVQKFLNFANDPATGIIPVVDNPGNGIAYMILPEEVPSAAPAAPEAE